jgi:hypothetical protein
VTGPVPVWPAPQSNVPPIPMLRCVCVDVMAAASVGTRGIWAMGTELREPSAYSQKVMGAPGLSSFWINSRGRKKALLVDEVELTEAPMETRQGSCACEQEKRKWPPVVDPTVELTGTEKLAKRTRSLVGQDLARLLQAGPADRRGQARGWIGWFAACRPRSGGNGRIRHD